MITTLMLSMAVVSQAIIPPTPEEIARFDDLKFEYKQPDGRKRAFRYRLLRPRTIESGRTYPLLLWLHGAGERGDDNFMQLVHWPTWLSSSDQRNDYECFVLVPQCPTTLAWATVPALSRYDMLDVTLAILDSLCTAAPIDQDRIYVAGVSSGGAACWDVMSRSPSRFAAAVPMGTAQPVDVDTRRLARIPIWAFHSALDPVVSADVERVLVEQTNNAGGSAWLTLTSDDVSHNCWDQAFREHAAADWLFRQRRGSDPSMFRPSYSWLLATLFAVGLVGLAVWRLLTRPRFYGHAKAMN